MCKEPTAHQLVEDAVNASYARSALTAEGGELPPTSGRIFLGLLGFLNTGVGSIYSIPAEVRARVHVRITMLSLMGKSLEQPYVDSLTSFNKQAKKFRKRL